MDIAQMEIAARAHRDEIRRLREENERLREENERLTGDRQNLELVYQQLNRTHESCLGDRDREFDRRVAAEAKLAKVVEAWGALQDSLMLAREYEASSSPTEREALRTLDSIAAAKGE